MPKVLIAFFRGGAGNVECLPQGIQRGNNVIIANGTAIDGAEEPLRELQMFWQGRIMIDRHSVEQANGMHSRDVWRGFFERALIRKFFQVSILSSSGTKILVKRDK